MLIAKLSLSPEHDVAGVLLFIFTSCPFEVDRHTIALQRRYTTLCEDMSISATQPSTTFDTNISPPYPTLCDGFYAETRHLLVARILLTRGNVAI